jgi:hypothetical protein
MGARASCPGGGTKRRLQGASATCRSLCRVGPTDANHIFRSTGTGPRSGWEDASRNTATFAVSREHRVGPGRSGRLNRTGAHQRSGAGRRRAGYGTAGRARRVSLRGGPTFTKKDNARSRYCTNPAGLFDWPHGVPVRATFYTHRKRIFFFVRCSHQRRLFTNPKMVDRFFRYSQSSRRLIIDTSLLSGDPARQGIAVPCDHILPVPLGHQII